MHAAQRFIRPVGDTPLIIAAFHGQGRIATIHAATTPQTPRVVIAKKNQLFSVTTGFRFPLP